MVIAYTEIYALDQHWSVSIGYDGSGYHEKNNPYGVQGFPNDKVIALPRLIKQENVIDEKSFPPEKPAVQISKPRRSPAKWHPQRAAVAHR